MDRKKYLDKQWKQFRLKIIESDDFACTKCGRTEGDGIVLQVHHKQYHRGRKPWEYGYDECETLCKGCHAREHGEIRPSEGWDFVDQEDLGDLIGACELCGHEIRYVFWIDHPDWESMGVGTVCCDNLTGTEIATEMRREDERMRRFVNSTRWIRNGTEHVINQKGYEVSIQTENGKFRIFMNRKKGKKLLTSLHDAKAQVFHVIESGEANRYFNKTKPSDPERD